jgi:hypothetical protein
MERSADPAEPESHAITQYRYRYRQQKILYTKKNIRNRVSEKRSLESSGTFSTLLSKIYRNRVNKIKIAKPSAMQNKSDPDPAAFENPIISLPVPVPVPRFKSDHGMT